MSSIIINYIFVLIIITNVLTSCSADTINNRTTVTSDTVNNFTPSTTTTLFQFNYNINTPTQEMELSKTLKEISGLVCYKDESLLAIQDEKGTVFVLDKNSGDIIDDIKFASKGDFEDIACVGNTIYVLRADGVLFKIEDWGNPKNSKAKPIYTKLSLINNTEGLGYDFQTNSLLIACKGSAAIRQNENSYRSIFSYSLESAQLNMTPYLNISIDKIKKYAQEHIASNPNLKKYMDGMQKKDNSITLAPSAIAVHPIDKNFYILSAIGRSLIVMNRKNEIIYIEALASKEFEQPEGLAFSSNGDLYICSEGQKQKAKIYKFDYQPN